MTNAEQSDLTPPVLKKKGFTIGQYLTGGAFSKIYRAHWSQLPNEELVVKVIETTKVDQDWKEKCLHNEMKIMKSLRHPNIIKVYELVKTPRHAYIFMAYAKNGSIADFMDIDKSPLKEAKAKKWFIEICNGLAFLHEKKVAHRDIKLDNFLLSADYTAMLSDFGFACRSLDRNCTRLMKGTACGTPAYMAPELQVLKEGQTYNAFAADMYSLGVCLFEMINYNKPFGEEFKRGAQEIVRRQQSRIFAYQSAIESKLSKEVKDLINKLLEPKPEKRIDINVTINHSWIK